MIAGKILVTGASGLLGHALTEVLSKAETIQLFAPSKFEMDCLNRDQVFSYMKKIRPDYVIHLAARVYGLRGNLENQLNSLSTNTRINDNILTACALPELSVKKIFFAGTVAEYAYPYRRLPLNEDDLLMSEPHDGEYGYAMAKRHALSYLNVLKSIHGISYTYGLFTNLYGPNDRFDQHTGHVIPSLLMKAMIADENQRNLDVWGNPSTTRDFMYSKDAANAVLHCLENVDGVVNIASGKEVSMGELVDVIRLNFKHINSANWQSNQPVGIPKRSVDIFRLRKSGFNTCTPLSEGIWETVNWMKNTQNLRH